MINAVMVTVKIVGVQQKHDMELPADIPIKELAPKLLMAFRNIESRLFLGIENIKIKFDAKNRYLLDMETLASVGVWDGSIISVERGARACH